MMVFPNEMPGKQKATLSTGRYVARISTDSGQRVIPEVLDNTTGSILPRRHRPEASAQHQIDLLLGRQGALLAKLSLRIE